VKPSLEKQPTVERGATKTPDSTGVKPRLNTPEKGVSQGVPVVELATPKGTKQSLRGNE